MNSAVTSRTEPLSGKRVHDAASIPDRQMKMREFGLAGKPDQSKRRPTIHLLTDMDLDASLSQMAVLCLPAFLMIDHKSIPTLAARDSSSRFVTQKTTVRHPVADAPNRAGSARQHGDSLFHDALIPDREIHSVMPIVGARTAAKIPGAVGVIDIHVVRHQTGFAYSAIERKGEFEGR